MEIETENIIPSGISEDINNICPVCYEVIKNKTVLECQHIICLQCLTNIYDNKEKIILCPLCRKNIINNNEDKIEEEKNNMNNNIISQNQYRMRHVNWFEIYYNKFYYYYINDFVINDEIIVYINNGYDIYEYAQLFNNNNNANNTYILNNLIFTLDNEKFIIEYNNNHNHKIILYDFKVNIKIKNINAIDKINDNLILNDYDETKLVNHIYKNIYKKNNKTLKELLCGEIFNEKEYKNINKTCKYKNSYYDLNFSILKNTLTITKYIDFKKMTINFDNDINKISIYVSKNYESNIYYIYNNDCYFSDLIKNIKKIKLFLYNLYNDRNHNIIVNVNKKTYNIINDIDQITLKYIYIINENEKLTKNILVE